MQIKILTMFYLFSQLAALILLVTNVCVCSQEKQSYCGAKAYSQHEINK